MFYMLMPHFLQEDLAKKAIGNNIVAEGKGPKPLDQHDTDDVNKAKQFPAEGAQDQAAKEGRGGDKADLERHDDKRRQQELLAALEAQRAEQERLLIEQKAVLQELKDHKKEHEVNLCIDFNCTSKRMQNNPMLKCCRGRGVVTMIAM